MKLKNILAVMFILFTLLSSFKDDNGYKVGDTAGDFKLMNIDGEMVSLSQFSDAKGFIVVFTCNHCPYSKLYEDRIIALDKEFKEKGYPVIAINANDAVQYPDDSYENMQNRAKEKGFTFPYLVDETQEVAKTYGATRTPHVFVLNKEEEDKLKVAYIGAVDDNSREPENVKEPYVEKAVNALLNNEQINPEFTKALGCTIKWKK